MEAYVYGGKEHYIQAFNAIAMLSGTDSISSLIRLVMLMGLVMVLAQVAFTLQLRQVMNWFLSATTLLFVAFVPKSDVVIHDRVTVGAPTVVANVPIGLAFIFSVATTAGDRGIRLMETAFGDPEIAKWSENGMIYASRLVRELNQMRWIDEEFSQNMQSFITNCVFYDLADGQLQLQEIRDSDDLFTLITVDHAPNPGRSGPWLAGGSETIRTCDQIATGLVNAVEAARTLSETRLARRMHPDDADAAARTMLSTEIEGAHTLLMGQSRNASDIFIQAMMVNSFREGIGTFSAESGADISEFGLTRAELQTHNTNMFNAALAMKWIPYLKVVLEIMFYSMFPLLFPFMLLPGSMGLIRSYFMGFIVLQAWGPLFVIANKIMMIAATSWTQAEAYDPSANGDAGTITLFNMQSIAEANSDIASIAGMMTIMIPVIAHQLAQGASAIASQSESLLSSVRAGASDGARDATTGNLSLASTGYDTHRFDQTFGNQTQMSHSIDVGSVTSNTQAGARHTFAPDGSEIYDNSGALSQTGLGNQFTRTIGSQFERRASEAQQYAQSWSRSATDSREAGASVLFGDREATHSMTQSILSDGSNATVEQRESAAIVQRHNAHVDQAYSQAVQEQSAVNMGIDGAVSAGVRGSAGLEVFGTGGAAFGEASATARAGWSENDSETFRADYRESLSSDEQRELNNALATVSGFSSSATYSQGGGIQNTAMRDAQDHFRQAQRYEESASQARSIQQQAQESAAEYESGNLTWSQPLQDQFLNFVSTQSRPDGSFYGSGAGWQDDVTDMIRHGDRTGELQGLLQGFADAQLPTLPQIGDIGEFEVGGAGLIDHGQIDGARQQAGDITTSITGTSTELSAANASLGVNPAAVDAIDGARGASAATGAEIDQRGTQFDQPLFDGLPRMDEMRRSNEVRETVADGSSFRPDFSFLDEGLPGSPASIANQIGQSQTRAEYEAELEAMEGFATRFNER